MNFEQQWKKLEFEMKMIISQGSTKREFSTHNILYFYLFDSNHDFYVRTYICLLFMNYHFHKNVAKQIPTMLDTLFEWSLIMNMMIVSYYILQNVTTQHYTYIYLCLCFPISKMFVQHILSIEIILYSRKFVSWQCQLILMLLQQFILLPNNQYWEMLFTENSSNIQQLFITLHM